MKLLFYLTMAICAIMITLYKMTYKNSSSELDKTKTNILFIHHSTGGNLLAYGNIRELLRKQNVDLALWDHSYNLDKRLPKFLAKLLFRTGLSDASGDITGTDYNITLSNNSPKEYAEIFSRSSDDPTLNKILQYDLVIIKNCFPTSQIANDKGPNANMLKTEYSRWFYIDSHSNKKANEEIGPIFVDFIVKFANLKL